MIAAQIRLWIEGPGRDRASYDLAVEDLYRMALDLAGRPVAASPAREPADVASDFLLYLRAKGNTSIATFAGLKREFRRFLARLANPASHEFWTILSDAINGLRKEGKAWRLDDPEGRSPNHNAAVWTGRPGEEGRRSCRLEQFERALASVRNYEPPGARRWHGEGHVPRIITPQDAGALLVDLLAAAGGAILFEDLFEAAKSKVFVFHEVAPPKDGAEVSGECSFVHPEAEMRFYAEARRRAGALWAEFGVRGLTGCLCGYFLPKHLLGEEVVLPKPTSTSSDQAAAIKSILASELLALADGESLPIPSAHFVELVNLVSEELFVLCRKNAETASSSRIETSHAQL